MAVGECIRRLGRDPGGRCLDGADQDRESREDDRGGGGGCGGGGGGCGGWAGGCCGGCGGWPEGGCCGGCPGGGCCGGCGGCCGGVPDSMAATLSVPADARRRGRFSDCHAPTSRGGRRRSQRCRRDRSA